MLIANATIKRLIKVLASHDRTTYRDDRSVLGTTLVTQDEEGLSVHVLSTYALSALRESSYVRDDRVDLVVETDALLAVLRCMIGVTDNMSVDLSVTDRHALVVGANMVLRVDKCAVSPGEWGTKMNALAKDSLVFDACTKKDVEKWGTQFESPVITLGVHTNGKYVYDQRGKHVDTITEHAQTKTCAVTINTVLLLKLLRPIGARETFTIELSERMVLVRMKDFSLTLAGVVNNPHSLYPDASRDYDKGAW